VTHMAQLVDELLDVSRITQGKITIRKETLELEKVISHAVETARPLIEARGHKLEIDLPAILQAGKNELDIVVANNDILYVDRAPMLYIYGEVQHPGAARLERGMTVLQALAASGGVTQRGTERGLKIHRRDAAGNVRIIQPKMNDMVERDDVIYVRESLF